MKKIISTVLCLFILLSCILPAMAATGVPKEVMESTKSVVRILSKYYNGAATGSGFVIKNEPGEVLIATNDHVVEGNPTSISIWVGEDRMVDAEIVFTTSEKDLCVLKVTDDVDMKPLKLSKEEPQHGAAIYVVGYPGAGDILSDTQAHTSESVTITDGIISAIRSFTIEKGGNPVKLLQVNAAINSGNSGGPLFNTEGVVVGVNTYKVNADSQGVFGSVDISELWSLLDQYGIEISEEPAVVEAEEKEVVEETSFLMPALICAGAVGFILVMILIAKFRSSKTPRRKRRDLKVQAITLQTHMEKYPQGLGIGGAVSLLLPIAIQLRNLHNDGKLHLQICPENIIIGADGASLKDPSSQETGRFNSGFAAPEIYRGAGFGITSDIYSFAAVLLYATTGKVPANSLQQDALEQDFSLLDDVIFAQITRKAMASNILDRTQSMQELIYSIAVYNAPVQERQSQPLRTVETVPVSISEERPAPAPVKEEQVKIPKHRKKTVPKKKHRKLLPIAAVLVCGIVAVVLLLKPAAKQDGSVELQSTEQTQTTIPVAPEEMAYNEAEQLLANGETAKAAIAFGKLAGYKDARERSFALWAGRTICVGNWYAIAVKQDGTVVATGQDNRIVSDDIRQWKDIVTIDSGNGFAVGLKCDGTVVANYANNAEHADVHNVISEWEDIVAIRTDGPRQTIGLQSDGTLVTTASGQIKDELSQWKNIIEIDVSSTTETSSPGSMGVIGLRDDGTVALYRDDEKLQDEWQKVKNWTDIVSVRTVGNHVMGIKSDGTVMIAGWNTNYLDAVSKWTDIVDIDGVKVEQGVYIIGLKADGTTVTVGDCGDIHKTLSWNSIVELEASDTRSMSNVKPVIGLKSDGTVVVIGIQNPRVPYFDFSEFQNIRVPNSPNRNRNETKPEEAPTDQQAQYDAAEKLLASGETAKAAIAFGKLGDYRDARQRSFSLWNTLIKRESIYCINGYFYGLKNDGYMVVAGKDEFGVSGNSDWKDVLQLVGGSKFGNLYQNDTCLLGLRSDGTVITAGQNEAGQCNVSDWTDVVKLWHQGARFYDSSKINGFWRYDYHNYVGMTVGLRADGTVVTTGSLEDVLDVSGWTDIVDLELSCSWDERENTLIGGLLVGVRSDGTVVLTGNSIEDWMKEMETWTDIVDVCLGGVITGLRSDGTVVYVSYDNSQCEYMKTWTNVSALIATGTALSDDGNLLGNTHGLRGSMKDQWNNLVFVNDRVDIGLKADGTVVVDAFDSAPNGKVRNWTDVVAVSGWSGNHGGHTIGIRSDGTVLAVGDTKYIGEVAGWTDIKLPDALLLSAGPKGTTPEEIPSDMQAQYNAAENLLAQGETAKAAIAFGKLGDYSDARNRSFVLWDEIAVRDTICAMGGLNELGTAGLMSDGTVLLTGGASSKFPHRKQHWEAMSNDVDTWTDIIAIASGSSLFGLKADGSVNVAAPNGLWSEVEQWQDIVSISASDYFVLGLKMDGTVQIVSWESSNEEENERLAWIPELSKWTDIVAVSAGTYNAVGLRENGTVVVLGEQNREKFWREIEQWQNIITISTGPYGDTLGLKADGTLLSAGGYIANGDWDVSQWHNIVDFSVGYHQVLGVKSDGTVVAAGYNHNGCISVKNWTDIIAVDTDGNALGWHTVGLKSDGTLVAVGDNTYGQCKVQSWTDIALPGQLTAKPKDILTDQQAQYDAAEKLLADGETAKAAIAFGKLGNYKDAREMSLAAWKKVPNRKTISFDVWKRGSQNIVMFHALRQDGTIAVDCRDSEILTDEEIAQYMPSSYENIVSVHGAVGLRYDGTLALPGSDFPYYQELAAWSDLIAISVPYNPYEEFFVGLKSDGTVVAVGSNQYGECNVTGWKNIIAIAAGEDCTFGLKSDGTVVATGRNSHGMCEVESWTDIKAITTHDVQTFGLRNDGTVVAIGSNYNGAITRASKLTDIAFIEGMYAFKEDGTSDSFSEEKWNNIVSITYSTEMGGMDIIGLRYDGSFVFSRGNDNSYVRAKAWNDIQLP